jgi:hypothetical protein
MNNAFLDGTGGESSPRAGNGMLDGRKQFQTTSESAAVRKAGETTAARQASRGPVRAIDAEMRSTGKRAISQAMVVAVVADSVTVFINSSSYLLCFRVRKIRFGGMGCMGIKNAKVKCKGTIE